MPLKKGICPPLLQETKGLGLTSFGGEVLLRAARSISEGTVVEGADGAVMYSGSTMVTVELSRLTRTSPSENWKREIKTALCRSIAFRVGLMRLARKEAELRCQPRLIRQMVTELEFTIVQDRLLVDIEVECPLAEPRQIVDDTGEELW